PNTVRSWTDAGRLSAYRINSRGDRRFRRGDVERLLVEEAADATSPGEVTVFGRVASGLIASPGPRSVARAIVEALRTDLGAQRVAVYVTRDEQLELKAHAGFHSSPPRTRALHGPTSSPDAEDAEFPLLTRRGVVGLLIVDATTAGAMSSAFARALLSTAGATIASARHLARSRQELRRSKALRAVTTELTSTLDLTEVLGDIVERTRSLFGAHRAGLWLFDDTPHPVPVVTRGLSDEFIARTTALTPESDTIGTRAMREGSALWMRNAHLDDAIGEMRGAYADEGIRTVCIVPLRGRTGTQGVIGLYHDDDRTWPKEEISLAQAFADHAAVAIQNARLYQSVANHAARMRSIQDLSARLNRLTDARAIAEAIVAEARTLADYHDIRVYRVDRERGMCDAIAFTHEMLEGSPAEAEELLRVKIGEGFTGWVAEHGEPLLINDALDDPRGKTIEGTDDVPESMLIVPMLYEAEPLGVIVLSQLGFNRFTADDLQTMSIFAGYAAQAMANATSYSRLEAQSAELAQRADSQRRLLHINERLLSTLDQAEVLETIADGLQHVVAYDNLSIYRADEQRRVMHPVLTRELHAEEVGRYVVPFGRGLMGWAVEHAEPILANDALNDPRAVQVPGTPADAEAVVVVPLVADGHALGAMNVSRAGGPEVYFSASDFELIQLFATHASIALHNADAHHAVSQRAETDALTGLGNHGAFQHDLGEIIADGGPTAPDGERRLALLMMDLDNFKAYNDRHGHPAGDALLYEIATAIYATARSDDRVYRYGGDEFALILPGAPMAAAAKVGQRIRRAIAQMTAGSSTPVTITIGVAGFPSDAVDRAGLIEAGDMALYYGKRSGEDRVVRADRLPDDVADLRGTLNELAAAALRDGDEPLGVKHSGHHAAAADSLRDALLSISRSFDARGALTRDHADRVGRLAAQIAERLRMDPEHRHTVELAGRLHALDDRGVAELSMIPSLHEVSTVIMGYRSLLAEGGRRGRRATRARGHIDAHVVAVANGYDELVSGVGRSRIGRVEALTQLENDIATYRSDVLNALAEVVGGQRHDRRRRRSDAPNERRGAA
ncbi:MAG TPA: GAF domain-containing protein, partial [Methylomirabilota bacterium]|nr:GAF domain-containing protein [Methylomirabilota bacterium]